MNRNPNKSHVSGRAIAALGSLALSFSAQAAPKHWNELTKVSKPENEGIHEAMKDAFVYLSFGNRSTCIPKTSLLNLPDSFASRVTAQPQFPVVIWSEFIRGNYSWVRCFPVQWEQATGKDALAKAQLEQFDEAKQLVIAVYLENPVSFHRVETEGESHANL